MVILYVKEEKLDGYGGMEVWRGSFEMGTAGYGMVWIMDGIAWGSGKGGCACTILFAM